MQTNMVSQIITVVPSISDHRRYLYPYTCNVKNLTSHATPVLPSLEQPQQGVIMSGYALNDSLSHTLFILQHTRSLSLC